MAAETSGNPDIDYDKWKRQLEEELAEPDPDIPAVPDSEADNPPNPVDTPQDLKDRIINAGKPESQPLGHAGNVAGILAEAEEEGRISPPIKASKD